MMLKKYIPIDRSITLHHYKAVSEQSKKTLIIPFDKNKGDNFLKRWNYVANLKINFIFISNLIIVI